MKHVEMTRTPPIRLGRYTGLFAPASDPTSKTVQVSFGRYTLTSNYGRYTQLMNQAWEMAKEKITAEAEKRIPEAGITDEWDIIVFDISGISDEDEDLAIWFRYANEVYNEFYQRGQPKGLLDDEN